MAYNNRNTLLKMVRVQDIVLREKRKGVSQIYVYEHLVKDAFLISYSTFNRWLAYPAKQELKRESGLAKWTIGSYPLVSNPSSVTIQP